MLSRTSISKCEEWRQKWKYLWEVSFYLFIMNDRFITSMYTCKIMYLYFFLCAIVLSSRSNTKLAFLYSICR